MKARAAASTKARRPARLPAVVPPARALVTVAAALLAAACSVGYSSGFPADRAAVPATDLPERFVVGAMDGSGTTEPAPELGCRNPMIDPRDGARLVMVRSGGGRADYEVPAGRYGVGEGKLLRLECATGRAIGVVDR